MSKRISVIVMCIITFFLVACGSKVVKPEQSPLQSPPNEKIYKETFPNTFGYSNVTGKMIITAQNPRTYDENGDYQNIDTAIGKNGNVIPVEYLKLQDSLDTDNGEQNSANFENIGGYLYSVNSSNVDVKKDNTFYMVNKNVFNLQSLVKFTDSNIVKLTKSTTNQAIIDSIQTTSNRTINNLWRVGKLENGANLYFAAYKLKGMLPTCSIIYQKDQKLIFSDYSESENLENGPTPELFNILFVQNINDKINISIEWIIEDGSELSVETETSGKFDRILEYLRYY